MHFGSTAVAMQQAGNESGKAKDCGYVKDEQFVLVIPCSTVKPYRLRPLYRLSLLNFLNQAGVEQRGIRHLTPCGGGNSTMAV